MAIFMPPEIEDRGHIVFVLSVCLFVGGFVCLSVRNFNLAYNFYILWHRAFIFGTCLQYDKPLPLILNLDANDLDLGGHAHFFGKN